ncbi:fumarylacetoacetase [Synchytrium endobioticum]|uniref:Fumarylacetoacetase n=1 Tax=Synchytrium endobioticum TaxID=286115 RepID=A0A507DHW1_9FUNG|nr:fumarylacetoacetase [Synchytrium endobioticum]
MAPSTIVPEGLDFGVQNIPFGVISTRSDPTPRPASVLGNHAIDLRAMAQAGLFNGPLFTNQLATQVFSHPTLNAFMGLTRPYWKDARNTIQALLTGADPRLKDESELRKAILIPLDQTQNHLPAFIGDYTDFYASKEHAHNAGVILRGPDNAMQPNWHHLPVAYHGRASSVVVSGTPIRRPNGLVGAMGSAPRYTASMKLDVELEMGFFIGGAPNALGTPVGVRDAEDRVFGFVLLNDWSARDIQAFEYIPLGPFLGKNFGTTISPWIVTIEALDEFRRPQPVQDPVPAAYLQDADCENACFNIDLEVHLKPSGGNELVKVVATNSKFLYWSPRQMIAHHTVNGCNLQPGDLCGTGTISGPNRGEYGSFMETSWNGRDTFDVQDGIKRTFLEDGDEVVFYGHAAPGIGFGECRGVILPALPLQQKVQR